MRVHGWSGVFRRRSSAVRSLAAQDREELRIGAAMAYVQAQGNLDGFSQSRSERLALMGTAMRRGLVAWDRSRECYVLSGRGRRYAEMYAPERIGTRPPAGPRR